MKTWFYILLLCLSAWACPAQTGLRSPTFLAGTMPLVSAGPTYDSRTNGAVAHWWFDETSGNVLDHWGDNQLTNSNAATIVAGAVTNCTVLVSNSLQGWWINDNTEINRSGKTWMLNMLVKVYTTNINQRIAGQYLPSDPNRFWSLNIASDQRFSFVLSTNGGALNLKTLNTVARINTNVWYLVTVGQDGVKNEQFLGYNGTTWITNTGVVINSAGGTSKLWFGRLESNPGSPYFEGSIDEVLLSDSLLTQGQCGILYSNAVYNSKGFFAPWP